MVSSATSLSGNGLRDWLLQRVSAVVLAAYTIFLLAYLICVPDHSYQRWSELFANPWMRMATIFVLLSVLIHGWVGMWTICTDYIKPTCIRLLVQLVILFVLIGLFFWGIQLLWGIY